MSESKSALAQALLEGSQKVEAKVQEAINEYVSSVDFSPTQGLDFLQAKNSLVLTYLIELTHDMRTRLKSSPRSDSSTHRLTVMKTVLDKSRGLEKKLRYQIDKLLASGTNASSFVSAESGDPLQLRPDTSSLRTDERGPKANAGGDDFVEGGHDSDNSDSSEVDADLEAARATVAASRGKKMQSYNDDSDNEDDGGDGVYRAPRYSAVPYNLDKEDKNAEREKRKLRRMRTSELAQALRAQYGEAPEQEDIHGGTELGKQREAAKRFNEQQEEKNTIRGRYHGSSYGY